MDQNQNDIYLRKDVWEAEKNNLLTAINDTRDSIDDLRDNINRLIAVTGGILCLITIAVTVILVITR